MQAALSKRTQVLAVLAIAIALSAHGSDEVGTHLDAEGELHPLDGEGVSTATGDPTLGSALRAKFGSDPADQLSGTTSASGSACGSSGLYVSCPSGFGNLDAKSFEWQYDVTFKVCAWTCTCLSGCSCRDPDGTPKAVMVSYMKAASTTTSAPAVSIRTNAFQQFMTKYDEHIRSVRKKHMEAIASSNLQCNEEKSEAGARLGEAESLQYLQCCHDNGCNSEIEMSPIKPAAFFAPPGMKYDSGEHKLHPDIELANAIKAAYPNAAGVTSFVDIKENSQWRSPYLWKFVWVKGCNVYAYPHLNNDGGHGAAFPQKGTLLYLPVDSYGSSGFKYCFIVIAHAISKADQSTCNCDTPLAHSYAEAKQYSFGRYGGKELFVTSSRALSSNHKKLVHHRADDAAMCSKAVTIVDTWARRQVTTARLSVAANHHSEKACQQCVPTGRRRYSSSSDDDDDDDD